jgi:hypothetical protein
MLAAINRIKLIEAPVAQKRKIQKGQSMGSRGLVFSMGRKGDVMVLERAGVDGGIICSGVLAYAVWVA